ncbi:MAG: hypothetical protein JSS82_00235 [Bacteroidetes bacterium]|nr:hypothetical protein [Bacteroidota bacterium]
MTDTVISGSDLIEYLESDDPDSEVVQRIDMTVYGTETARERMPDVYKKLITLFIQFLVRHNMLWFPSIAVQTTAVGTTFSKSIALRCRDMRDKYDIHGNDTDPLQEVRLIVHDNFSLFRKRFQNILPSGSEIEIQYPTKSIIHPFGVKGAVIDYGNRGITNKVILAHHGSIRQHAGAEHYVSLPFHVSDIFTLLIWVLRSVIQHPMGVITLLTDGSINPRIYLRRMLTLQNHEDPDFLEEKKEFFGLVNLARKFITNDELVAMVNRTLNARLVAGLLYLLVPNYNYIEIHDIVRIHKSFWIENLQEWLNVEDQLGLFPNINDVISALFDTERKRYYGLVLPDFNVFSFLCGIKVRSLGENEYMFSDEEKGWIIHSFALGLEVPHFTGDRYRRTTYKEWKKITDLCQLFYKRLSKLGIGQFRAPLHVKGSSSPSYINI